MKQGNVISERHKYSNNGVQPCTLGTSGYPGTGQLYDSCTERSRYNCGVPGTKRSAGIY